MLYFLMFLFILVSLLLILIVLIQKGRGGGLSSAFGGGGGGNTAFGAKTGDVLTWATSIMFGVFMLLAIGLNLMVNARVQPPEEVLLPEDELTFPAVPVHPPPPAIEDPVDPREEMLPSPLPEQAPAPAPPPAPDAEAP